MSRLNLHPHSFSHTACKPGYFKPSVSSELCQVCPDNTKPSTAGAAECQCEEGFFRSPSDPPTSACSGNNPTHCHTWKSQHSYSLEPVWRAKLTVSSTSSPSSTKCPSWPDLHHPVSRRQAAAVLEPTASDWGPQWPHLQCFVWALWWTFMHPLWWEDPFRAKFYRPTGNHSHC